MKQKILTTLLLGGMLLGTNQVVFASEHTTIDNGDGKEYLPEKGAEIPVKGTLGKMDNTNPEENIPEGDEKWLRVELPTKVFFNSAEGDGTSITSSEYRVSNKSARPINVNLTSFTLPQNGVAAKAIDKLSLQPKNNTAKETAIDLAIGEGKPVGIVNKLLSKLEPATVNAQPTETQYKFRYTGIVNPQKIVADQANQTDKFVRQTVSYVMTLKFEVLGKDGKPVNK